MKLEWDYSSLAKNYDLRADYSKTLFDKLLSKTPKKFLKSVIDIGAGTGKLTKILISKCKKVTAVEPNDNMRNIGIKNLKNRCVWIKGQAEKIDTKEKFTSAFFGSSFNVINHKKTIKNLKKILNDKSLIFIVFNHRDLQNKIQLNVENIIKSNIKDYSYGLRRKDLKPFLVKFKNFSEIKIYKHKFQNKILAKNFVDGFKSHATIKKQSKRKFNKIIKEIGRYVLLKKKKYISVPYTTVIYTLKFRIK